MKATFTRPATLQDAISVASRIRDEDRQEALASVGIEPSLVLPAYVQQGREVYASGLAGLPEDCPDRAEILFGFDPIFGVDRAAVAWAVMTPVVFERPVELAINSRLIMDMAHQKYDLLTNFVDERNVRHIKWLKWLGWHALRRVDRFGAQSRPFIEFASYRTPA